jgi:uncharacterized protein YebE (UPF0316 family)
MIRSLFIEGGVFGMTLLTVELILLILAAWKAPAWVKEIGIIALMTGIMWTFHGLYQINDIISQAGDISMGVIAGGLRITLISVQYGGLIYIVSLIMRIIQKPRI